MTWGSSRPHRVTLLVCDEHGPQIIDPVGFTSARFCQIMAPVGNNRIVTCGARLKPRPYEEVTMPDRRT